MKAPLPLLAVTFLLTGCASLFKAPPDADMSGALSRPRSADRSIWIEVRAGQLERSGMSEREAKAQALTEAALRGR